MTRDEALAEIDAWKAALAGLPELNKFDGYTWQNNSERGRVDSLDINTLVEEFEAAEKRDVEEQKRKGTLECLRERMGIERNRLAGFIRDHNNLVSGELQPANLAAAIARLDTDIQADETLLSRRENEVARIEWQVKDTRARELVGWEMRPDSAALAAEASTAKDRLTPLRARLTRMRAALSKLRGLVMVPGDISKATVAILNELHEANMAAEFNASTTERGPAVANPSMTEAEYLRAHGVTHDTAEAEIE